MIPNYFFATLSVCIALLTLAIVLRLISMLRFKSRSRRFERMDKEIDELTTALNEARKGRDFQDGVIAVFNKYINHNGNDEVVTKMLYYANMLPDIKDFGHLMYMAAEQRVNFVIA
jgi:hypothetical protein